MPDPCGKRLEMFEKRPGKFRKKSEIFQNTSHIYWKRSRILSRTPFKKPPLAPQIWVGIFQKSLSSLAQKPNKNDFAQNFRQSSCLMKRGRRLIRCGILGKRGVFAPKTAQNALKWDRFSLDCEKLQTRFLFFSLSFISVLRSFRPFRILRLPASRRPVRSGRKFL